jgi:hypothetical protein
MLFAVLTEVFLGFLQALHANQGQYCQTQLTNYKSVLNIYHFALFDDIQGDSGGNVNILGSDKKKFHVNVCLILNGCRGRAV